MQEITFEQVLNNVQSLPPESQTKLRDVLNATVNARLNNIAATTNGKTNHNDSANDLARSASLRDLAAERQWLKEHCDEYVGQWVALKGDQLISYGANAKEVYLAAKAAGHMDAFLEQVESSDALPFIF